MKWVFVIGVIAGVGCRHAGTPDAGIDAGTGDAGLVDSGVFVVAAHQPYPTMPWNGGPVLAQPNLVTVTYATDPNAGTREAFGDWVFTSQWYQAWRGEYGIGPGVHLGKVRLSGTPPSQIDETSAGALLLDALADGGLPTVSDGGVLYALYLPSGPTPTFQCRQVCEALGTDFIGGFHWEAERNGTKISFALIPTCGSGSNTESQGGVEFSASHELAEGITDPYPVSAVAYDIVDPSSPWNAIGGEVADLCSGQQIQEAGHTLQRIWSNASASDGGAPCIPALPEPFYSASATPTTAQTVLAGSFIDFDIQLWSAAPVGAWNLNAAIAPTPPCLGGVDAGVGPFTPSLSFVQYTGVNNGESRALEVVVPSNAPSGSSAVILIASARSQTDYSLWPLLVVVQ
jgi:hypothetical protein